MPPSPPPKIKSLKSSSTRRVKLTPKECALNQDLGRLSYLEEVILIFVILGWRVEKDISR